MKQLDAFAIFALFKEEFQLLVLCQRLTVLALSSDVVSLMYIFHLAGNLLQHDVRYCHWHLDNFDGFQKFVWEGLKP